MGSAIISASTNELKPNLTAVIFVNDKPVLTRKIDQAANLNLPGTLLDERKLGREQVSIAA